MKSKRTTTEKVYLWWHRIYGSMLILFLFAMLFERGFGYYLAYGLIPQGVVQILFGLVAVVDPKQFRLKNSYLLWIWLFISTLVLISSIFLDQFFDLNLMQFIAVITLFLPVLQFSALYFEKFKY